MTVVNKKDYAMANNSFGQAVVTEGEDHIYQCTEEELIEFLKGGTKQGAPILINVKGRENLLKFFGIEDWDDTEFVHAWTATCFGKGWVRPADKWEEVK